MSIQTVQLMGTVENFIYKRVKSPGALTSLGDVFLWIMNMVSYGAFGKYWGFFFSLFSFFEKTGRCDPPFVYPDCLLDGYYGKSHCWKTKMVS